MSKKNGFNVNFGGPPKSMGGKGGVWSPKSDQTDIQVSQNEKCILGNLRQYFPARTSKMNVSDKARRRRENFEDLHL